MNGETECGVFIQQSVSQPFFIGRKFWHVLKTGINHEDIMLNEVKPIRKKQILWFHFMWVYGSQIHAGEWNGGCKVLGWGGWTTSTEFQFCKLKSLKVDDSGYTTMCMYLMSSNCTLKMGKLVNFIRILSQLTNYIHIQDILGDIFEQQDQKFLFSCFLILG